jgi:leucyl-tRNA synthetase
VFTGAHAINPVNGRQVPIWTADYVLAGYGTGAIMSVPAHDSRDLEFAQKFKLPVEIVVQAPGGGESLGFTGNGTAVNSGFLDGLPTPDAKVKITAWLEGKALGQARVNYKLRDWLFSRQRYWGEPFPITWDEGGHLGLSEGDLPLTPPDLSDFKPTGTGDPPLARAEEWCHAGDGQRRETNTMPQWAGSCWYYLSALPRRAKQKLLCRRRNGALLDGLGQRRCHAGS